MIKPIKHLCNYQISKKTIYAYIYIYIHEQLVTSLVIEQISEEKKLRCARIHNTYKFLIQIPLPGNL